MSSEEDFEAEEIEVEEYGKKGGEHRHPARVFRQSRWGKGAEDEDDGAPDGASPAPAGARSTPGDAAALGDEAYVNCPFDEAGYKAFVQAIVTADKVVPRAFEEARYFEG